MNAKNYYIIIFLILNVNFDIKSRYLTATGVQLDAENTLVLYQMMKDIDELFCQEKIQYWAIGGTLLGAVRHLGIIPWDHEPDIDIGINAVDNQALLAIKNEIEKLGYVLRAVPFGYKIHAKGKVGKFPFIDIFVFTYEPKNDLYRYAMYGRNYFFKNEIYPIKRIKFGSYFINCPANPIPYLDSYYKNWRIEGWHYVGGKIGFVSFLLQDQDFLPALPIGPLEDRMAILKS